MTKALFPIPDVPLDAGALTLTGVVDGMEGFVLAELAQRADKPVIYVARDAQRAADVAQVLGFAAPDLETVTFPAWDCLPYDRVSPGAEVTAQRLAALTRIAGLARKPSAAVVLTTANAVVQRIMAPMAIARQSISIKPGQVVSMDDLIGRLAGHGFSRVPTVREVGEFAVRGGILDIYAPGPADPVRLDFFGDTLESIRSFDPASQRTTAQRKRFVLRPMSEVPLDSASVTRFRTRYIERFGAPARDDALYASIVAGGRFAGMEHWLPLFAEELTTLFDALPDASVVIEHLATNAPTERCEQFAE